MNALMRDAKDGTLDVSFDEAEISVIDGIFRLPQRVETDEEEFSEG